MYDRHDGEDVGPLGHKLILPSSHVGSPRFMTQLFQDAMAICRHFHKPDLFLTMTANPKWPVSSLVKQLLIVLTLYQGSLSRRRKYSSSSLIMVSLVLLWLIFTPLSSRREVFPTSTCLSFCILNIISETLII